MNCEKEKPLYGGSLPPVGGELWVGDENNEFPPEDEKTVLQEGAFLKGLKAPEGPAGRFYREKNA